jgi:multidrug efflux pump subunit AcrA (membrane-fusion protein)
MRTYALPLALAAAFPIWLGCRHTQVEAAEAATFVLSDTMLAAIKIDTTVIRPVENELRLPGKVTSGMRIMANVSETDVSRLKEGYPVDISTVSHPDKIFHGRIDKVYNMPDPGTGTMRVRIRPDNEGMPLKPGKSASVLLRYGEGIEMPAIPSAAVIFDKRKTFVMVFRDKFNIHTREIKVARVLNGTSYVSRGLLPGEMIISRNQLPIYDALNN